MDSKEHSSLADINMTPLVDIMLVLLIVFIIAAPLIVPQTMGINLPKTQPVQAEPIVEKHLLQIRADGTLERELTPISNDELSQWLAGLPEDMENSLIINADEAVNYGRIAEVMAIAQNAGVARLAFRTLQQ